MMTYDLGFGVTMKTAHLRFGLAAVLAGAGACSGDVGDYAYMDDDIPSGRCETGGDTDGCPGNTEGATTGPSPDGGPGSPCDRTGECDDGLTCSAPFSGGERGTFACVEACIPNMDESRWCADADGCCDPDAVCTMRGYCVVPDDASDDSTDGGSTGGADDSTGDSTEGDDSSGDSTGQDDSTGGTASGDDDR
jgi:hypothetical protein